MSHQRNPVHRHMHEVNRCDTHKSVKDYDRKDQHDYMAELEEDRKDRDLDTLDDLGNLDDDK